MVATVETYPCFEDKVRTLVQEHRKIKKPELLLAVYYAPPRRAEEDVFVLELINGFGENKPDPEGRLFEFGYGSTPVFELPAGASLRMVLTNPIEFEQAVRAQWKGIRELRAARQADKATVIYADKAGKKLWDLLR